RAISGQMGNASPVPMVARRSVLLGNERFDVEIEPHGDGVAVRFEAHGETRICISGWKPGEPVWNGTVDGECLAVKLCPVLNGRVLTHGGAITEARVYTRREAELTAFLPKKKAASGLNVLRSPMPALVKSIEVVAGQE